MSTSRVSEEKHLQFHKNANLALQIAPKKIKHLMSKWILDKFVSFTIQQPQNS